MGLRRADYDTIRSEIKVGDIIAFSGKDFFSEIIKFGTKSNVSHVGIIYQSTIINSTSGDYYNLMIEAVAEDGVRIVNLSQRLEQSKDSTIWWLPLRDTIRDDLKVERMLNWLLRTEHKPYDLPQAIASGLDLLDKLPGGITRNIESFERFFCSELIAGAFEEGKIINSINASEVTPIDLCMFDLYKDEYYQLVGKEDSVIRGFNSVSPENWGEA